MKTRLETDLLCLTPLVTQYDAPTYAAEHTNVLAILQAHRFDAANALVDPAHAKLELAAFVLQAPLLAAERVVVVEQTLPLGLYPLVGWLFGHRIDGLKGLVKS